MSTLKSLLISIVFCLPLAGYSQDKDVPVPLSFRAVLHDPIHPTTELYFLNDKKTMVKLEFRPQDLSQKLITLLVNGSLVLYDSAAFDPLKPEAHLAASCSIPPSTKRAMVIVLPRPPGSKPAYQLIAIDDSAKAFPVGESRVISLIPVEAAIQAGEHRLAVHPGKITNVPPVKKVNPYNMAQTNFYYQHDAAWVPFTERQLQYLDAYRRLFIIHVTPGAISPTVTTIVDTPEFESPASSGGR